MSVADAIAAPVRIEALTPAAGDRPFVEFRSRARTSPFDNGHVFVVVGRERDSKPRYTATIGFYPTDDGRIKSVFHGPGAVEFGIDRPSLNDTVFRAWVTESQASRVAFVAKQIQTEGKTYSFPLQTCVDFARDLARTLDLETGPISPPMPRDPLIPFDPFDRTAYTPSGFVDELRRNNSGDAPIVADRRIQESRSSTVSARREWETQILRTTPMPRPDDNPVGAQRRGEMSGSGIGVGIPIPIDSKPWEATVTPVIPEKAN